ncbi:hypothetical protein F7725_014402 [Dissostichus mawsoni]|uniref:DUF1977 domain-containing protein n=1 Tax=Dissostichus mawsoni TaxID=36200 RepID=A0A7J5YVT3_DISMA|nr:hypothetical protein F7725_014402 [Dissostichus mawsoni]
MYANGRMRNQRRDRRERPREGGFALFVQVMPILILVIVSALSQIMVNSPPYSLSYRPSAGYTQKRLTMSLKVPYYVGEHFSREITGLNLKNLERTVEDDFISNLRNNCWKEKQQKEGMLYRARYFGDNDLYQRAQRARTPSCAKLSEITASLHALNPEPVTELPLTPPAEEDEEDAAIASENFQKHIKKISCYATVAVVTTPIIC